MKKVTQSRWLLWMMAFYFFCVISMFSAQNAERSTVESESFVEEGFKILESTGLSQLTNTAAKVDGTAAKIDKKVFREAHVFARQVAHFVNFMILGFLYSMLVCSFKYMSDVKMLFITLVACLVAAALDEFHQYFVPGRSMQFIDVIIDFTGSCFGSIVFIVSRLRTEIKRAFAN